MSGVGPEPFDDSAGDRRKPELVADARGRTASKSSNAAFCDGPDADPGRRAPPADGFDTTADGWGAGPSTLKISLQLAQRIRAAGALSGMEPLDWHDGQITTLDKRPSCGESTASSDWIDKQEMATDEKSVPHGTDHCHESFLIRAFPTMRFKQQIRNKDEG
jgi:hypothetical protein